MPASSSARPSQRTVPHPLAELAHRAKGLAMRKEDLATVLAQAVVLGNADAADILTAARLAGAQFKMGGLPVRIDPTVPEGCVGLVSADGNVLEYVRL